jgi:hypothetical protein
MRRYIVRDRNPASSATWSSERASTHEPYDKELVEFRLGAPIKGLGDVGHDQKLLTAGFDHAALSPWQMSLCR